MTPTMDSAESFQEEKCFNATMDSAESFPEEKCFNVWWEVKNFSFCSSISSPDFCVLEIPFVIEICMESYHVKCSLTCLHSEEQFVKMEISFLTCDGSKEESISCGGLKESLQVPEDVIFGIKRKSFLPEDALTVRIRILTASEGKNLFMCSEIPVNRKCFLWTFKNFSTYRCNPKSDDDEEMKRLVEDSEDLYGEILLFLKPDGERYNLELFRSGGKCCYIKLELSVMDVDGKALNCVRGEFVFQKNESESKVFYSFIKKSDLASFKNLLLPDDTLSLKCDFAISTGKPTEEAYDIRYSEDVKFSLKESGDLSTRVVEDGESDFLGDMKSMLKEGSFSDVILYIGLEEVKAHKNVLSARSPVIKSALEDTMEADINRIMIEDVDLETVGSLLLYMYTDTMPQYERENTKKLYLAADKYEVLGLKKKCVSLLITDLSVSNVYDTMVFAELHRDRDLKLAALNFISALDCDFFSTGEWKELESKNSSLALQVVSFFCNKVGLA